MAFRILDQYPQYFSADGTSLLVGGSVTFYESGTSVLATTYTDPTLELANSNPLTINAQGRISDVWGNANYRMVVADALGNIQWTLDNVQGPAVLPNQAGNSGDFLSTDGANLLWAAITQVPAMLGQSGKYLTTDGVNATWGSLPAPPSPPPVSGGGGTLVIGTDKIQSGTGTFPATGLNYTTLQINFPKAFSGNPYFCKIAIIGGQATAIEGILITQEVNQTPEGFLAYGDTGFAAIPNSHTIIGQVSFQWIAWGPA